MSTHRWTEHGTLRWREHPRSRALRACMNQAAAELRAEQEQATP